MFFPFLFSFFLSQWFLLGASHAQCSHDSRIDRTMIKVFAHRELRGLREIDSGAHATDRAEVIDLVVELQILLVCMQGLS